MSSRVAVFVSAVAVSGCLTGCFVPESRYREARSQVQVEQEAHRRTQQRLTDVARKLDLLGLTLDEREKKLAELEANAAQAKLDGDVAQSERQYALELVEQLRSELGRTGDHLREFAAEKNKLATALDAAEKRAKGISSCETEAQDNAALMRDLAVLLHEPIAAGDVELESGEGHPIVRVPSSELSGETPGPIGQKVLAAVARVGTLHKSAHAVVSESGGKGDAMVLKRVADQLAKAGLATDRVELRPSATAKAAPEPTLDLALYVVDAPEAP